MDASVSGPWLRPGSLENAGFFWKTTKPMGDSNPWVASMKRTVYSWNPFVLYFGGLTLQDKVFSIQNRGHLGSSLPTFTQ